MKEKDDFVLILRDNYHRVENKAIVMGFKNQRKSGIFMQESFYRIIYKGGLGGDKEILDQSDLDYLYSQAAKYHCVFPPFKELVLPLFVIAETPLGRMRFEFYRGTIFAIPLDLSVNYTNHADLGPYIQIVLNFFRQEFTWGMETETVVQIRLDKPFTPELVSRIVNRAAELGASFASSVSIGFGVRRMDYQEAIDEINKGISRRRPNDRLLCLTDTRAFNFHLYSQGESSTIVALGVSSVTQELYLLFAVDELVKPKKASGISSIWQSFFGEPSLSKSLSEEDIRKLVYSEGFSWYQNFLQALIEKM
jgi:hypothetical protein